jgi:hypothetical protein
MVETKAKQILSKLVQVLFGFGIEVEKRWLSFTIHWQPCSPGANKRPFPNMSVTDLYGSLGFPSFTY